MFAPHAFPNMHAPCSSTGSKKNAFLFVCVWCIVLEKTMPPKKVMKSMKVKNKGLEKPKAKTGLKKPKKGLEKPKQGLEKPKKGLEKPKLSQANLEKLGQLSLKDKMKAAAEQSDCAEDAAIVLYDSMTKNEKAKAWSKHQTALKKATDEEKAEYDKLPKKDKGIQAAAHLLEKDGKQYMAVLKKTAVSETHKQNDSWVSELQMLQKWTADELEAHMASGRIRWRECPGTWGVYEYKDTQDWSREIAHTRAKEFQEGKEYDPDDEDLEKFLELYGNDWTSLSLEDSQKGSGKSKGLGKGPSAKGPGKGKSKRTGNTKADIEDETCLDKVLKACKKARNMVSSCKEDLEMALEKAKGKLSKAGQKNAISLSAELGKAFDHLKACLHMKDPQVENLKGVLRQVAEVMKEARDETKELKHLGNKTGSVASKKTNK